MQIRPISTKEDYEEALAEVKRLWRAPAGTPARGRLEVLAMLAHHYERTQEPLPGLNPIDAIEFRMEQMGLSRRDLLPVFGSAGRTSEILAGKRSLTLEMIRRLHALLGIPLESLIQPNAKRPKDRVDRRAPVRKVRVPSKARRSNSHAK